MRAASAGELSNIRAALGSQGLNVVTGEHNLAVVVWQGQQEIVQLDSNETPIGKLCVLYRWSVLKAALFTCISTNTLLLEKKVGLWNHSTEGKYN